MVTGSRSPHWGLWCKVGLVAAVGAIGVHLAAAKPAPVATVACRLCGDIVDRWVSVVWEDAEAGVERVHHSAPMVELCSVCSGDVATDVLTAVRSAVDAHWDSTRPRAALVSRVRTADGWWA